MTKYNLSEFKYIRVIEKGSYGVVSEYEVPKMIALVWGGHEGMRIAAKAVPRQHQAAYEKEKKSLVSLPKCEGVVRYYGEAEDKEYHYLFTRLGVHGDLYTNIPLLLSGTYNYVLGKFKAIMNYSIYGLLKIHERNLIHQDIKPQNIILSSLRTWECFISDVGSMVPAQYYENRFDDIEVILTIPYMAPEQVQRSFGNRKSDVWSLAITFLSLSVGHEPYNTRTNREVVFREIVDGTLVRRLQQQSLLFNDPAAADLLLGMLEASTELRFSAKEAYSHPFIQNTEFKHSMRRKVSVKNSEALDNKATMSPPQAKLQLVQASAKSVQTPSASDNLKSQLKRISQNTSSTPTVAIGPRNARDSPAPKKNRPASAPEVPENQRVIGSKNVVQKPKRATPTEPPKSRETGGKSDTQRRSPSNDSRKSTRL